ncbi:schlafen-like protein 2 [Saccoglossus kowalevskii]
MKYYVRHSVVPFEEDVTHEFKGHRTLCIEDLPEWSSINRGDRERRSRQSISRTICAFLNTRQGGTIFLGIVDNGSVKGIRLSLYQKDHVLLGIEDVLSRFNPPVPEHLWQVQFLPIVNSSSKDFKTECDNAYLTVHPALTGDTRNGQFTKSHLKLPPVFENEERKAYFRRQASLITYTMQEIKELSVQQVRDYYQPHVDALKQKILQLKDKHL